MTNVAEKVEKREAMALPHPCDYKMCANCCQQFPSSTSLKLNLDHDDNIQENLYHHHEDLIVEISIKLQRDHSSLVEGELLLNQNMEDSDTDNCDDAGKTVKLNVFEVLSAIYKFNYHQVAKTNINFHNDDNSVVNTTNDKNGRPKRMESSSSSSMEENRENQADLFKSEIGLCHRCSMTLAKLYKYYDQLAHYRHIDSFVARTIRGLDSVMEPRSFSSSFCSKPDEMIVSEKEEENKINLDTPTDEHVSKKLDVVVVGQPFVKLHRLTPEELILAGVFSEAQQQQEKIIIADPLPSLEVIDNDDDSDYYPDVDHDLEDEKDLFSDDDDDANFLPHEKKRSVPKTKSSSKTGRMLKKTKSSSLSKKSSVHPRPSSAMKNKRRTPNSGQTTSCSFCGKNLKVNSMYYHMLKHRTDKNFLCNHCGRSFPRRQSLRCHISRYHEPEHRLKCDECDRSFYKKPELARHKANQHGLDRPFKCSWCDKSFATQLVWKAHQRIHDPNGRTYLCNQCGARPYDLERHNRNVHPVNEDGTLVERFSCQICTNRTFKAEQSLKRHIVEAHSGNCRLCPHCGRQFSTSHSLKRHIQTHTGEKPFACSICPAAYRDKRSLKRHLLTHEPSNGPLSTRDEV